MILIVSITAFFVLNGRCIREELAAAAVDPMGVAPQRRRGRSDVAWFFEAGGWMGQIHLTKRDLQNQLGCR